MNLIETIGAVMAAIVTVALVAVVVQPNSTAPKLATASGNAFASSIKAATLKG